MSEANQSRRANSINPLNGPRGCSDHFIDMVEAMFDHFGKRYCARLPEIANELDIKLASRGYQREAETLTLFADQLPPAAAGCDIYVAPGHAPKSWLDFYFSMSKDDQGQQEAFCRILNQIALPKAFGETRIEGRVAAIAYAVAVDDLVVLEAVVTDPRLRRRGLAQKTIGGLMAWAADEGCTQAALQVVAENEAATNLYAKLGFSTELYRYHYRVKDQNAKAS
ncbi:GNAT family N-acetyltransferase [Maritalea sp. P4.10X]|uniref:GNAT family N-acetyltransferase n=2 Tax=Maritalea mediterranea TaxID=2909667 RepID=A0ABS9E6Y4_9HYPH|nr:GNAT family N-acetyltransferase [Maritalea mediterranea]